MPRKANAQRSKPLRLSVHPTVHKYLSALKGTGLYGNTEAEAAVRLIVEGIENRLEKKLIARIGAVELDAETAKKAES